MPGKVSLTARQGQPGAVKNNKAKAKTAEKTPPKVGSKRATGKSGTAGKAKTAKNKSAVESWREQSNWQAGDCSKK